VRRAALIAAALAGALLAAAPAAPAQERAKWNTRLLALVPPPGFPALAYVHPNRRIYVGTYVNPQGDSQRSRVLEYEGNGTLVRSWTVPGQNLSSDHGVQVTTSDSRGRLVLLDRSPARALLLDRHTGGFSRYSTFADLPACPGGQVQSGCSPTLDDLPPAPNYGAWGPDGSLYVTDFLQGVVWRVPPGGGTATVWLSDRRLDGNEFGTTGIALLGDRRTLLVAQGSSAGLGALNPTTGKLYKVEIRPNGRPGSLRQLWESRPTDLPDGFAIARSGRIYVPLAGTANQIAVVAPGGQELERFPRDSGSGANGSGTPFDTPSSARFLGTRLIVANQSFTGDRAHQALLDVETREGGLTELIPGLRDRSRPSITRARLSRRRFRTRGRRRRGTRIRFRLNERATVFVRVERRRRGRWRRAGGFSRTRRKGNGSIRFMGRVRARTRTRRLRTGRYRFVLRARDAAGNRSRRVTLRFRVVR
jgi:sugar lactone lactonase YvrE